GQQSNTKPIGVRHVRHLDDGRYDQVTSRGDVHPAVHAGAEHLDALETERQLRAVRISDQEGGPGSHREADFGDAGEKFPFEMPDVTQTRAHAWSAVVEAEI